MIGMVWIAGRFCPQVFCDHCGERIKRAADGNYHWGAQPDLFFTHKRCCHAFDVAHPGIVYAEPLEGLPWFLAKNLGLDPAKKPTWVKVMEEIEL